MNAPKLDRGESVLLPEDIDEKQRLAVRRYATWRRFHRGPRQSGKPLLKNLARYPNCVLVAGCQRSGTTILTRVIAGARGFQRYALTPDDELDAALILAGEIEVPTDRRYCFQTVYLNQNWHEYRTLEANQKIIWVLRNPYSVVYSMIYNWKRAALTRLYESCLTQVDMPARLSRWPWPFGLSRIEKACFAYTTKTSQVPLLRELVAPHQLLIVDYDSIVAAPSEWLSRIFAFIEEPYDPTYAQAVRTDSVRKANSLSDEARRLIERHAEPAYQRCLPFIAE